MKAIGLVINCICLIGAVAWYKTDGGWEPAIAIVTFIGALLYLIVGKEESDGNITQKQEGGKGSINNQAGGDISINSKQNDV